MWQSVVCTASLASATTSDLYMQTQNPITLVTPTQVTLTNNTSRPSHSLPANCMALSTHQTFQTLGISGLGWLDSRKHTSNARPQVSKVT